MADTDVYRVMYSVPDPTMLTWYLCTSNAHPHGLHTELKSARMSIARRKASKSEQHRLYKIQKLELIADEWCCGELLNKARLDWVDVDV